MPTAERTWEISDLDGSNKRTVTPAQFQAELDAAKAKIQPVVDAFRRRDLKACAVAQAALRYRK